MKGSSVKKTIDAETRLQRKSDMVFSEIDGEVVMLSIENSEYYGMDKIGSRIWEMLENSLTLKELIDTLIKDYDVEEQKCTEDVLKFLYQLSEKNLITVT